MTEYELHGPSNITDADEGIHWDLAESDVDQIDTWWSGNINMKDENGELAAMQVYVQNRTYWKCAWLSISVWKGIKKNQVESEYHLAQLHELVEVHVLALVDGTVGHPASSGLLIAVVPCASGASPWGCGP